MAKIEVSNVSLTYPVYGANAHSFKTTMLNMATGGLLKKDCKSLSVEALKDVSFQLKTGDRLALIGHNGAGKSTLLKVLAKIYEPTQGRLLVEGRVNCLFDILMGMDHELTGYENIKLRGLILNLSKKEIQEIIPKVEEFSELGSFMKMPIKTYSSGMKMRLAFGMIINVFSEILLIDEVVNIGDSKFIQKAKHHIKSLVHESDIMVFSSHDPQLIKEFCNQALLLKNGVIQAFGTVEEILALHNK